MTDKPRRQPVAFKIDKDPGGDVPVLPPPAPLPGGGAAPGKNALDLSTSVFSARLVRVEKNRAVLLKWIRRNLVEEIDFGKIHMYSKTTKTKCDRGNRCEIAWHWSKPSLRKPGAEKICALLGLTPRYPGIGDLEQTINREGGRLTQIIFHCVLVDTKGHGVGEGVGGRDLGIDGSLNKSIKMAKKSALIDATLSAGGLSELFTQDFGDDDPPDTPDFLAVLERCPVGPFKGQLWNQLNDAALDDLRAHPDVDDETKLAAKGEVERRLEHGWTAPEEAEPTPEGAIETLRDAATSLQAAHNADELRKTWDLVPERFRVPLTAHYETLRVTFGD